METFKHERHFETPAPWETQVKRTFPMKLVERELAATVVERLWGSNGRKRWLTAVSLAELGAHKR